MQAATGLSAEGPEGPTRLPCQPLDYLGGFLGAASAMAALARRFSLPVFEQFSTGDLMLQDQSGAIQRGRGFASMQGSYRLAGGMQSLTDALASEIDATNVLLETSVLSLTASDGGITAALSDGRRVNAKRVALAVPPRVIAETITFEPKLDAAQLSTMQNIPTWMAGQAKIVASYDQPYWRYAGLSGDAMSHRGPMVEIHDASPDKGGPYALFGFVGVPADVREVHGDEIKRLALAQLIALFGAELARPLDLVLQDWATLPEIARPGDRAGLHSHPSYGLPSNLRGLWEGALLLTSTETAQGFGGFLEGALEAAERTATNISVPISSAAE